MEINHSGSNPFLGILNFVSSEKGRAKISKNFDGINTTEQITEVVSGLKNLKSAFSD